MKTLTLEEAVTEVVSDFLAANKTFSAHEVTTEVRNRANSGTIEVSGIPYGYVDACNTHSQQIQHSDVRDIVSQVVKDKNLIVVSYQGYKTYGQAFTPSMQTPVNNCPTIEDRVNKILADQFSVDSAKICPTATFENDFLFDSLDGVEFIMAVEFEFSKELNGDYIDESFVDNIKTYQNAIDVITKIIADANKPVTVAAIPAPTPATPAIAVPQRFQVNTTDAVRNHVVKYVRGKLNDGINPNLHQIAKTVRGITVKETEDIVLAEGFVVVRNPNSSGARCAKIVK